MIDATREIMLIQPQIRLACLIMITLLSTTAAQANLMSKSELDLVVKEDIAAAQILNSICPTFVADSSKIKQQVHKFTTENLTQLSNPSTTFEQLSMDPEYLAAYKAAQLENKQYSQAEQKQGCENLLNIYAE